jgi:glycosyltransferase involved in cell wall biosynthesis
MNIVFVFADSLADWNSSEWRCVVPTRAINRSKRNSAQMLSITEFAENLPPAQAVCRRADVIVVQRQLIGQVLQAIQHWKARDKVVIADFDDAYDLIPCDHPDYPYWVQGLSDQKQDSSQAPGRKYDPSPIVQFKWGLQLVHASTVPSKRLAGDWQAFTEIYHLPNYIDLEKYPPGPSGNEEDLIIGWGGSESHVQSYQGSGILSALKHICRARPHVKVMVCGKGRRIFEKLPLPPEQKIFQPWVPYEQWPRVLTKFDIGLAPLHGPYDERRSWIKVLEYMAMKIPWIASEGPAYAELRPYGWLVKNSASAWERLLLDMVDHIGDYRAEAARDPYLFALGQSIDENIDRVTGTYLAIAQRAA